MLNIGNARVRSSSSPTKRPRDITSDPFFSTGNTKKTHVDHGTFGHEKYSGTAKIKQKFEDRTRKINQQSKHIKKDFKYNKNYPKFGGETTDFNDKFEQVEEDAEYKLQSKNKCRDLVKYTGDKPEKKPFDKKKWRLQKYSKKYRLDQWEEKRKKAVLNEYYQKMKDENVSVDVKKIYEQYDSSEEEEKPRKNYVQHPDFISPEPKGKKSTKKKVQMELERLKEEKKAKKEEMLKRKQEKEEALKMYKQKKMEKQKQLNKKTKRGQPIMKGRIEMLLDQIQNS